MDLRRDIYFYATATAFPTSGSLNVLYVDRSTGIIYSWNGTSYAPSGAGSTPTGLNYQGLWDANANLPLITSSVGTVGDYYIVGTAGTTNINGINDWGIGDWIVFSSTNVWQKIDNSDREGYNTIEDEGSALAQRSTINFVGSGVSAADSGGKTVVTISAGSSSGRFGIADSSGAYTYYTTLSLAMTAATAGQTIEFFTDYTESGATTVTLKNNVTINGNGHRYTHTSTTGNTFNFVAGATVYINNLIIDRTVTTPTGAAVFYVDNSFGAPMTLRCSAVFVNYTFTSSVGATPIITADALTQYIVEGLNATANGSGAMFTQSGQPITVINCFARNTATGNGYSFGAAGGTIDDSYASVVSGTGIALVAGSSARNCNSIATTGVGISGAGNAYQCYAFSNTNYAYNSITAYNCVGQTTSGTAFYGCTIRNCSGTSTTGAALVAYYSPAYAYNSSLQSTGGVTIPSSPWSMLLENCSITNEWNNASGHAVTFGSSGSAITNDITNCKITVSNASANCLNVASAINAKYANNVFKGATTPVNANITQTIVNTQDNQGNILI